MSNAPDQGPSRIYIDLIGDLFHAGHLKHLEKAKSMGGRLIVGLFSDDDTARLSHVPVQPLEERVAVVAALRCVDEVVPAAPICPDIAFLDKYDIDNICLSDDFSDAARQAAMAALLDDGIGIVLPYGEEVTTASIISRITGVAPDDTPAESGQSATVHPVPGLRSSGLSASAGSQAMMLEAIGALAGGVFGRGWLLGRAQFGDDTWLTLLKCMGNNLVERQAYRRTDPRFVPALVSVIERFSRPGDAINLIGNASKFVGPTLAAEGHAVTILRPDAQSSTGGPAETGPGCSYVYCSITGLADASPPADLLAILDPAWSAFLMVDGDILFEATFRLKRDVILCVDFWPENSGSILPVEDRGQFAFSDSYVRNSLHGQGYFQVEDFLTTIDGAPCPEATPGCNRLSRQTMDNDNVEDGQYRYLDGGTAITTGKPEAGKYLRWYRASKQSFEPTSV